MEKYELTQEHFDYFIKQCKYFVTFFGLQDWEMHYLWEDVEDCRASCTSTQQGKICTISLGKVWHTVEPTQDMLCKVAFHEVWELLTSELEVVARNDFDLTNAGRREVLERARHTLIRRMENCVLPYLPTE